MKDFFVNSVLPELFGKFYSRTSQPVVATDASKEPCCSGTSTSLTDNEDGNNEVASAMPLYCYCQKPDDGGSDMVGCDNPACSREWFHRTCLKLNSLPTCKYWYCPDCRKLSQFKKKRKKTLQ